MTTRVTALILSLLVGVACHKKPIATPPATLIRTIDSPATPTAHPVDSARLAPPTTSSTTPGQEERINALLRTLEDAYFDYNRFTLRTDAMDAVKANAQELRRIMRSIENALIRIDGHCDERGSAEYNVALGLKRAESASLFLSRLGIPNDQLRITSSGKEHPQCSAHTESCWQQNRRVRFSLVAASASTSH